MLNQLLTDLRKHGSESEKEKVAILPARALNSKWPALETLAATDRVLHLMGETDSFRTAVGQFASQAVCVARQRRGAGDRDKKSVGSASVEASDVLQELPSQLGFSREVLLRLARTALHRNRRYFAQQCLDFGADFSGERGIRLGLVAEELEKKFHKLHEAVTNSCDDKRPSLSSSPRQCEFLLWQEYLVARRVLREVMPSAYNKDLDVRGVCETESGSKEYGCEEADGLESLRLAVELGPDGPVLVPSADDVAMQAEIVRRGDGSDVALEQLLSQNSSSSSALVVMDHMSKVLYDMVYVHTKRLAI